MMRMTRTAWADLAVFSIIALWLVASDAAGMLFVLLAFGGMAALLWCACRAFARRLFGPLGR